MSTAVRYFSRSGNTKAIAEAIAKAAEVEAVSVDAPDAALSEKADVLFIGGALYAYGLDSHLNEYLAGIKKEDVGKAVLFSTSWISKHSLDLMRKALEGKGIPVESETLYFRGKPSAAKLKEAEAFAKRFI